jgi:hypothetical protein
MTSQTTAQQWIRTRDRRTGRRLAVAVPSASVPGKFHLTTASSCDCRGFQFRRTCRHLEAVRAEIAARASKFASAESIIDSFTAAPAFDGSMAELARRQELVALADAIWGTDGN